MEPVKFDKSPAGKFCCWHTTKARETYHFDLDAFRKSDFQFCTFLWRDVRHPLTRLWIEQNDFSTDFFQFVKEDNLFYLFV